MAKPAPHLCDEILEEIFLRLPTPAALARVSTACPSFRSIIAARSFLRRFRKLHPPPLLGFLSGKDGFHPAEEPHPSAPLARALADAADFSCSFVPKPNNIPWSPRDVRDGRVLLECSCPIDITNLCRGSMSDSEIKAIFARAFTNLAVCDPVSRRYVLLPPIPKEITVEQEDLLEFEPMLAPIGEDVDENEDEDETSFKVICTAHYKSKLVAFVFSSVTGQWCMAASPSWSSLGTVEPSWRRLDHSNYVRGCFYWTELWMDKLLVLDVGIMEFSTVGFTKDINPSGHSVYMSTVVDGTKGGLEMLTVAGDFSHIVPTASHLYHTIQQNNDRESSGGWQLKNVMEFPRRCLFSEMGAKEGFLFLRDLEYPWDWDDGTANGLLPKDDRVNFISLEVKTLELKKLCMATYYNNRVHSYFGFPPSLSKPSL